MALDYETLSFKTQKLFEAWLQKNHTTCHGIWLKIFKKDSDVQSLSYAEALDVALCFGWIDGQKRSLDNDAWLQKFTPRRKRSKWSKRNIEHVERLLKLGRLKPAGLNEINAAKSDGRWADAYDPPSTAEIPEEFFKKKK